MNGIRSWKRYGSFILVILLTMESAMVFTVGSMTFQQTNIQNSNNPKGNDWWPMFRHDLSHSGLSTSSAPEDNSVLWSYQTNYFVSSSPVVYHGCVYVGSWDNNLYCFDIDSGNLLWNFSTTGEITSSPAVVNGKVYVGSEDTKLYCLNAVDGMFLWDYQTNYIVESSPAVFDGKVFFGSNDGSLYCLNADDGILLWRYQTNSVILSSPAVSDGKVFCGTTNGEFFCLESSTGNVIWIRTLEDGTYSSPIIAAGKMYIGSNDKNVYCLDATDGMVLWNYSAQNEVHSSPAVAGEYVYIGTSDGVVEGRLLCLQKDTGAFVWSFQVWGGVEGSPAIADGKIYFGTDPCCGFPSYLYCLNAITGAKIWEYDFISQYHMKSSPAIAAGKVFVGSPDGKVYAFGDVQYLADANGPYYNSINTPVDFIGSVYGGVPGYSWYWDFGDSETSSEKNPIHTYTSLGEYSVSLTVTDNQGTVATDDTSVFIEVPNSPPASPEVSGIGVGKRDVLYEYNISSTDVNNDSVSYFVDWGDNSTTGWIGPYLSGNVVMQSHSWSAKGSYLVTAKAKDMHGAVSNWSTPYQVDIIAPLLSVELHGGIGLTATFQNIGNAPATNISWAVTIDGGVVVPKIKDGTIPFLSSSEKESVKIFFVGLGRSTITVYAIGDEGLIAEKTIQVFLFLIFIH
jgi:eukaryotic-like serine/threonine-protein kinase